MKGFIQRHGRKILGVLSGFDRMRFRGSFTPLTTAGGLWAWLWQAGVLLKNFKTFAEDFTRQIRQATEAGAIAAGRPVRYLNGFVDKEAFVRRNTLKMYDKQGTLLRVESTLNDPRGLKVYRHKQGEARSAALQWRPLRKGVADLARRAQLSQASNQRYLEPLARATSLRAGRSAFAGDHQPRRAADCRLSQPRCT
jgi:hypothetical protein